MLRPWVHGQHPAFPPGVVQLLQLSVILFYKFFPGSEASASLARWLFMLSASAQQISSIFASSLRLPWGCFVAGQVREAYRTSDCC